MGRSLLQLPGAIVAAALLFGCEQLGELCEGAECPPACPPELPDCDTDVVDDVDTDMDTGILDTDVLDTDVEDTDTEDTDVEIPPLEICDGIDNDGDCMIDEDCQDCDEGEGDAGWSEAIVNGYVSIVADAPESIVITNLSSVDILLNEQSIHTSARTQAAVLDPDVIAQNITLHPGDSLKLYYASYTTANGNIDLYLGENAWWCIESGQSVTVGAEYEHYGETLPEVFAELINADNDVDGDLVEDHVDWAGPFGVQTQYSLWEAEESYAILTIGKLAEVEGTDVRVKLFARNLGMYAGSGTVTDVVPAGWSVTSTNPAPDSITVDGAGNTVLTWNNVIVDGYTAVNGSGTTLDKQVLRYTIEKDVDIDVVYTELAPATIEYFDTVQMRTGVSMKAWIRALDVDGSGVIDCIE